MSGRKWFVAGGVPRETLARLDRLHASLVEENERQNLVARGSEEDWWDRHFVDSAQLVDLGSPAGSWLDLGSGAGFPGLVIAILTKGTVHLVESRRLRAEWLSRMVAELDLPEAIVHHTPVERLPAFRVATITARAFAPLPRLLALGARFAGPETRWVLPKGRSAQEELASVRTAWHGEFVMHPSRTSPGSAIIVASGVRAR